MTTLIYPTSGALADGAADFILDKLSQWEGPVTLGLAGGGTPRATYARLVDREFDWSRLTVWLPDERWVPADHPDSNARMARESFIDSVGASMVIPDFAIGEPAAAASAYLQTLDSVFVERNGGAAPDLVLLGIGDDGHTASLFPSTPALDEVDRGYVANWVTTKDTWRLTATYPLLWSARHVAFLVAGEAKAAVLAEILAGADYPAAQVAAGAADVTWLVDEAAASRLTNRPR
jgi:6-phosphogluconolactonase